MDSGCYASNRTSGCSSPSGALLKSPPSLLKSPGARAAEPDALGSQPFPFPLSGKSLQDDDTDLLQGGSVEADLDTRDGAGGFSL